MQKAALLLSMRLVCPECVAVQQRTLLLLLLHPDLVKHNLRAARCSSLGSWGTQALVQQPQGLLVACRGQKRLQRVAMGAAQSVGASMLRSSSVSVSMLLSQCKPMLRSMLSQCEHCQLVSLLLLLPALAL